MRVFRDLDLVEQLGSGIPRILEHYPCSIYHFSPHFIRLVLPYAEGFDEIAGQASDQVTDQAADQAEKLLSYCSTPRTMKEIMDHLHLSHRPHFRKALLTPLLKTGKLIQTIPEKPSSPNQRYVASADSARNAP